MVKHGSLLAITLGRVPPIKAVNYDRDETIEWDSGFLVVFSDAPPSDEVDEDAPSELLCLHCLIDEHPEVGAALDLARVHGEVWLDGGGEWVPLDEVDA